MPVTAKLLRKFYDKSGDDIANELVEWFNQVDTAYRAELRELADTYFARFEAKLQQGIAELRAELHGELRAFESRLMIWLFVCWATTLGTLVALIKL